jgi:hypothetical protein
MALGDHRLYAAPMARVLVVVVCLLSLGLPAFAQDSADAEQAKQIEELIALPDGFYLHSVPANLTCPH